MQKITIFISGIILLLCVCCTSEDKALPAEGHPAQWGDITFEIGFSPLSRLTTGSDFKSSWENGDAIGIYAVNRRDGIPGTLLSSGNYFNNVKLTYNNGTWSAPQNVGLWWPADGSVLDFYCYYPYDDNNGSPESLDPTNIAFAVEADQTGQQAYGKSNLLAAWAYNNPKKSTVRLHFVHKMALLQVNVPYMGKGTGPQPELTVKLKSAARNALLDLNSGNIVTTSDNQPEEIKMMRVEQPSDPNYQKSYTYRALIPEQQIDDIEEIFIFGQNQKEYTFTPASPALFTAGYASRYEISLPPKELETVLITAGEFLMGSSDGSNIGNGNGSGLNTTQEEDGRNNSRERQHKVKLTKDFYMTKYTITNAQFAAFLNDVGVKQDRKYTTGLYGEQELFSSYVENIYWDGNGWKPLVWRESLPMVYVNWFGATEFARWAGGQLPTEAQWEYACRAGRRTAYYYGDTADASYMNYYGYPITTPSEVGMKLPNAWGLYDMHGNVSEWCSHPIYEYPADTNVHTDPNPPVTTTYRAQRGGSAADQAAVCRSAHRLENSRTNGQANYGFRIIIMAD